MNDPRRDWLWKMLVEVFLIGVAVFLGMAADQWRSDRQHREAARQALQRIRAEVQKNQTEVERVREYHVRLHQAISMYLDPATRATANVRVTAGINPAKFERTAWDLALATQALADIDQDVSFELAAIYGVQQTYDDLSRGLTQAMYLRPPGENLDGFLQSLKLYYDDITIHESDLLGKYAHVVAVIDSALRD